MKIGIFGGTFNPVHFGHLRAAEEVRESASLDKVLFIPSGNPPLKREDVADSLLRLRMVDLAIKRQAAFEILDIEAVNPGKSYTVRTLQKLRTLYAGSSLYFILGIDAFLDIPNWLEPDTLLSLVNFVVISRPGHIFQNLSVSPYIHADQKLLRQLDSGQVGSVSVALTTGMAALLVRVTNMEISSSDIRQRIKKGASIKYLLPEEVELFIIAQKLYNTEAGQV